MLGQTLARLGRTSEAVAEWKKAIEIQPEHAEALYNLSRASSKTDPAESGQYQARFVDLQKKRQIVDRAEMLGNFALASAAARTGRKRWPSYGRPSKSAGTAERAANCTRTWD
jgi:tetratricopeptide (TPR) repeat protein